MSFTTSLILSLALIFAEENPRNLLVNSPYFLVQNTEKDLLSTGLEKALKGDLLGAIADFDEVIRQNPNSVEAYNNRGNIYTFLSEFDRAQADYNRAIELDPNYAESYNNRGTLKDQMGDILGAIEDYNRALRLNPDYPKAYYNRGIAHRHQGQLKKALDDYNDAIRLNPSYAKAYYNRGGILFELKNYPEALLNFQKAAQLFQEEGSLREWENTQKIIKKIQSP